MAEKKSEPFHFEAALSELNALVEKMEQGDIALEESLALFEQGIKLTKDCQKALNSAQQKVKIMVEKQGKLVTEDFEPDNANG